MSRLADLEPQAAVQGILLDGLLRVVSVQWLDLDAAEISYKTALGRVANERLYRHDEQRIEVVEHRRPWSTYRWSTRPAARR
jgi:uncharacterized coiled-coil protein SlyX